MESFVLQGLDVIPRTAGIPLRLQVDGEKHLVAQIEYVSMHPRGYEPAFYAAVLRKWRSDAVCNILRARGVLQTGMAQHEQIRAEFGALQRADIAKHGLLNCALRSCAKTEKTAKEFAHCTGCRSVVYCCLEHQELDWKTHKKESKDREVARRAAEDVEKEEVGAL